jgi:hypothetical protein
VFVTVTQKRRAGTEEAHNVEDGCREIIPEEWAEWRRHVSQMKVNLAVTVHPLAGEPVYPVRFLMIPVITQLILYVKHNQHTTRHPNGKPENINKGVSFVSQEIPEGDLQVVGEQKRESFCNSRKNASVSRGKVRCFFEVH